MNKILRLMDDLDRLFLQVFVNCLLGYSRSAAIVAAFLMIKRNMTATQALTILRQEREILNLISLS